MWQVLLAAAAAAGSTGFVAKHLFCSSFKKCEHEHNGKLENPFDDAKHQSPVVSSESKEPGNGINCKDEKGIFRFSSPESGEKNVRKKSGSGVTRKCKNEKRSGGVEVSKRRVAVCLKKRKTNKNAASDPRCESCSSKDSSLFNWGLGVGIMYMMSTGRAEISKLNVSMDETAKFVQELKSELHRRKLSHSMPICSSADELAANSEEISGNDYKQMLLKSRNESRGHSKRALGFPVVNDGEYASSVLTEERDLEAPEMDQLEAELESELQKLPWCATEAYCSEDVKPNLPETEASTKGFNELEEWNSDYYQSRGVSPSVLDQKLSRLLIEQQGNQIVDLESDLQSAQSKLREKETELQALKDCVRRLTEFSLSAISDDDASAHETQECNSECDVNNEIGFGSRKSFVGMKRPVCS